MLIETAALITFTLACIAIVIVPGPTVTVIIANSLKHGARAGLLNVAGTQLGLAMMIVILALGLEFITASLSYIFEWLRLAGAAYLVWLGYKLLRSDGTMGEAGNRSRPGGSFFWQGFLVIWSNPKALFFFGAFIPQFVDPAGNTALETMLLGGIFMVVATVLDGAYAVAAGKAGAVLTQRNIRGVEVVGGTMLVGGGIWLGLARG